MKETEQQQPAKEPASDDYQAWLAWLEETLAICRRMQHEAAITYHLRALLREEER